MQWHSDKEQKNNMQAACMLSSFNKRQAGYHAKNKRDQS